MCHVHPMRTVLFVFAACGGIVFTVTNVAVARVARTHFPHSLLAPSQRQLSSASARVLRAAVAPMPTGAAFNKRVVLRVLAEQGLIAVVNGFRIKDYIRNEHGAIFWYVKVQLQLQEAGKGAPRFKGPLHCATHTLRHSGLRGLYVGLPPWVTFALPRSAIRFTTFERVSGWLQGGRGEVHVLNALAAGTVAGAAESASCLTPLQNIQIKMTQDAHAPRQSQMYRGFFHALSEIPRREGLRRGFFSGLWPTVVKGAVNNCIRFGLYNEAAGAVRRSRGDAPDEALGPGVVFGLGAAAGAVSAVVTHPIDTVKSNLQGLSAAKYSSSLDCARQILASDGVAGLFRGLTPRICRVCLEIGLQFSLYDSISRFMDKTLG